MAEVEEPQFTSLQERIAALNQSQNKQHQTFGKRPPPPVPSSTNRPAAPARVQTVNNPPIATYDSSTTKQSNDCPIGVKKNVLPPPPVDRDNARLSTAASPNPARKLPPQLPGRATLDTSPALPPRKGSSQLARQASSSSISSTVSGMSLNQSRTASSRTSTSSVDAQRKLPPAFDPTKLPVLPPPNLRGRDEKAKLESVVRPINTKFPLVSVKSAPAVPVANGPPRLPSRSKVEPPPRLPTGRDEAPPPQPPRPSRNTEELPPPKPPRPSRTTEEAPPRQPPRRQQPHNARQPPPPAAFHDRSPNVPAPSQTPPKRTGAAIQELDDRDFDSVIMRGQPTFVKLYSPHCYNCQMMQPAWEKLGEDFAFASDRFMIAQIDTFKHMYYNGRYKLSKYPTLLYFDGHSETPERYQEGNIPELDPMVEFLEERIGISRSDDPKNAAPVVNMSSKPSFAQVQAVQSRPPAPPPDTGGCLVCRDYSGPDQVASEHPRESLPPGDKIAYLADVLCRPFRSPTDKARAIYRWLAYNIAYDTAAFFGNNVKHVDPKDTVQTGLAVCGGYAGLYVAIARRAGLDCEMVTGHGKGFGYKPLKPGERVPPCKPDGHAWNAVRIDDREWKLLDACWGAGNVTEGSQSFNKVFKPSYFTMSNDDFGIKHFPQEKKFFFREDGSVPTWEDYFIGPVGEEPLQLYGLVEEHGLSETSFSPPQKRIPVNSDEMVRFQFSKICEHWDHEQHGSGKPYCLILRVNGAGGSKKEFIPFDHDDYWWWLDIPAGDLGVPGQDIGIMAVTTINGSDARGVTKSDYLEKKGRCGMGFGGVCGWDLV